MLSLSNIHKATRPKLEVEQSQANIEYTRVSSCIVKEVRLRWKCFGKRRDSFLGFFGYFGNLLVRERERQDSETTRTTNQIAKYEGRLG